jgi:hypothetical protein
MTSDQDHPMGDTERGRMSTPGRSPRNRLRSASPRTLHRSNRGTRRRDTSTPEWKWNPINECIVHSHMVCETCRDYIAHLNEGAMDDDPSFIDARAKRSASYVSISMWRQDTDKLSRIREERDALKARLCDMEHEMDTLRCEYHDMETRLHAQNSAPSYAAATKGQRPSAEPGQARSRGCKADVCFEGDQPFQSRGTTRGATHYARLEG